MVRRGLAVAVMVAGCWAPTYPVGLSCSDAGTCPPGQVCRQSVCREPDDFGPPDGASYDGSLDAPVTPTPDAPFSAAGLGATCSSAFLCPDTTPTCRSTDGDGTNGFCTLDCGVDQGGTLVADDTICQNGYTQAAGVPRCLFADDVSNPTRWFCGLLCGNGVPTDDGACPYDLGCVIQQGDDAPAEICGE
jgi:hypothetical protein